VSRKAQRGAMTFTSSFRSNGTLFLHGARIKEGNNLTTCTIDVPRHQPRVCLSKLELPDRKRSALRAPSHQNYHSLFGAWAASRDHVASEWVRRQRIEIKGYGTPGAEAGTAPEPWQQQRVSMQQRSPQRPPAASTSKKLQKKAAARSRHSAVGGGRARRSEGRRAGV